MATFFHQRKNFRNWTVARKPCIKTTRSIFLHSICPRLYTVTADEIANELSHLEGRKAVPQHIAPSFLWKELASTLGELLAGWCSTWFCEGHLPEQWRSGWIVFLTKPNKAPTQPNALRPIALQTPIAKSLMSIFVNRARQYALPTLRTFPQFAYLPGRGTRDAICRVVHHVQEVEQLSERWKYKQVVQIFKPQGHALWCTVGVHRHLIICLEHPCNKLLNC